MSLSAGEITAIMTGIVSLSAWAKLFHDTRKNGKNSSNGKRCSLHEQVVKDVTGAKTEAGNLKENLGTLRTENHTDHEKINTKLDNLTVVVTNASSAAASAASAAATIAAKQSRRVR